MRDQIQEREWTGSWVWDAEPDKKDQTTKLMWFRRTFQVMKADSQLILHLSADSRYRLFVNGHSIGAGPCKGDVNRQYYDSWDVSAYLQTGDNVISVKVLHYRSQSPTTLSGSNAIWRSPWGGLILDGELCDQTGRILDTLHTDERWVCRQDHSYSLYIDSWMSAIWLGGMESVDGTLALSDATEVKGADQDWSAARIVIPAYRGYGIIAPWRLIARSIPQMAEKPHRFAGLVRSGTAESAQDEVFSTDDWIELDAGELTTGYLEVELCGGRGAEVIIRYAECYEDRPDGEQRHKGIRDDYSSSDRILLGDADRYRVAGYGTKEAPERYEPFWFRTFRYIRLEIRPAGEPVRLKRVSYRETGYPLQVRSTFASNDESLSKLWDISVRTLQRCMHETYEDCPYYEQLQYTMDTALQALFTYYLGADDRLARKAIHDFHSSRLPDGMLQSRFPSVEAQVIPGFSLYWIAMLHDHYTFFGDEEMIRSYLPTVDGVLNWFRLRIGEDGLVARAPKVYWAFVDWVDGWPQGTPPAADKGPLTVDSLMFAWALQMAAQLHEVLGRHTTGEEYREMARLLNEAVALHCRSEDGMFRDGPHDDRRSQHPQIWSVLSGLVKGEEARTLLDRTLQDKQLPPASYPMMHFLFRALSAANHYEASYPLWQPWHDMVAQGLTTWAEKPGESRSDCHAWGALPLYEFTAEILGVKSGTPGFKSIIIRPQPGPLRHAEGTVATPQGPVHVSWQINADKFSLKVDGPGGVPTSIYLPNGERVESDSCRWEGEVRWP